jgi:hypothetical protein
MDACSLCGAPNVKGIITHRRTCARAMTAWHEAVPWTPDDGGDPISAALAGHADAEGTLEGMIASYLRALGSKGGKQRSTRLTPEQRSAAARKAAKARWKTP